MLFQICLDLVPLLQLQYKFCFNMNEITEKTKLFFSSGVKSMNIKTNLRGWCSVFVWLRHTLPRCHLGRVCASIRTQLWKSVFSLQHIYDSDVINTATRLLWNLQNNDLLYTRIVLIRCYTDFVLVGPVVYTLFNVLSNWSGHLSSDNSSG